MNLNFFENLSKAIEKTIEKDKEKDNQNIPQNLSQEEMDLAKKLGAIEEYTVDRFEGNIAVLENRNSGEMLNVEKSELPYNIKEGEILKKVNGKYFQEKQINNEVEERISKKMDNLWKN